MYLNRLINSFPKPKSNYFKYRHLSTNPCNIQCDVAVVGAGIVGTSIARKLKLQHSTQKVLLVEKECTVAKHQSSHNSGVMHCGVYYTTKSLKAKFCVQGIDLLQKYCEEKNIKFNKCGKLIVAKECSEVGVLEKLLQQGEANCIKNLKLLESQCEIQEIAPGCRGSGALWCPQTANVDFKEITQHFLKDFQDAGGKTLLNTEIVSIAQSDNCEYPLNLISQEGLTIQSKYAIGCGGLQSDSLTKLLKNGCTPDQYFISLKVDYQKIDSKYCENLQTNIYPVPDLELPFLGGHFSPQLDGSILLGPYALPALKVEGYCNEEVNINYMSKLITSCGFRNMVIRNFSKCVSQASKALCNEVQIKDLQQLLPNFSYQLVEKGPTAVQCQLLNRDGTFVNDFVFDIFNSKGIGERIINVKFTPSPAATSSLAIANYIVEEYSKKISQ
ncbi:unnamed protein product [Ceutorhynchus assimilis]|uniref:L-2-hydroxyglutarate dehydrogenase, mitochondrial n=1 Tax=Ceutorhynchus assimilis TaxID=467358 RepID=A0A9N9QRW7_9CUCU|nr:unnamed protein product [Ceutorhynchus assimilis]